MALLGAMFRAAVDAHTSALGPLPSRDDIMGLSGPAFEAEDGLGRPSSMGALDGF